MSTLALADVITEYKYDDIAQNAQDISFDRYDAMFAGMSGLMAGIIDVFLLEFLILVILQNWQIM